MNKYIRATKRANVHKYADGPNQRLPDLPLVEECLPLATWS